MNSIINQKAEAVFQLKEARSTGIQQTVRTDDNVGVTIFNNRTVAITDFNSVTVQFELNGQIYSVCI